MGLINACVGGLQVWGTLLYSKDGMPVGPFSTIGYGPETE